MRHPRRCKLSGAAAAAIDERGPELRVPQDACDGNGHVSWVTHRDDDAGTSIIKEVRRSARTVGRDDWHAASHGLDQHERRALVDGRECEDVTLGHERKRIRLISGEPDVPPDAKLVRPSLQVRGILLVVPTTDKHEPHVPDVPPHESKGLDQRFLALARNDVADRADDLGPRQFIQPGMDGLAARPFSDQVWLRAGVRQHDELDARKAESSRQVLRDARRDAGDAVRQRVQHAREGVAQPPVAPATGGRCHVAGIVVVLDEDEVRWLPGSEACEDGSTIRSVAMREHDIGTPVPNESGELRHAESGRPSPDPQVDDRYLVAQSDLSPWIPRGADDRGVKSKAIHTVSDCGDHPRDGTIVERVQEHGDAAPPSALDAVHRERVRNPGLSAIAQNHLNRLSAKRSDATRTPW